MTELLSGVHVLNLSQKHWGSINSALMRAVKIVTRHHAAAQGFGEARLCQATLPVQRRQPTREPKGPVRVV